MKEQLGCQTAAAATAAWLGCSTGRQDPGTLPEAVHIWLDTPCSCGCPQLAPSSWDGGSELGLPEHAPSGLWPTTNLEPAREASSQLWARQMLNDSTGSSHTQLWMGIPHGRGGRDSSLPWRNEAGPAAQFSVMNL